MSRKEAVPSSLRCSMQTARMQIYLFLVCQTLYEGSCSCTWWKRLCEHFKIDTHFKKFLQSCDSCWRLSGYIDTQRGICIYVCVPVHVAVLNNMLNTMYVYAFVRWGWYFLSQYQHIHSDDVCTRRFVGRHIMSACLLCIYYVCLGSIYDLMCLCICNHLASSCLLSLMLSLIDNEYYTFKDCESLSANSSWTLTTSLRGRQCHCKLFWLQFLYFETFKLVGSMSQWFVY